MRAATAQVDSLLVGAHQKYSNSAEQLQSSVNNQKKFHEKNLEHYNSSREAYLKRIEETVEFVKKEGISGAAKLAADTVAARVEDAKQLPAYFDKEAKVRGCAPLLSKFISGSDLARRSAGFGRGSGRGRKLRLLPGCDTGGRVACD